MSHSKTGGPRARLALTALEDRSTPAAAAASASGMYAVGVHDGQTGDVVVHAADGSVLYTVPNPYGSDFTGGVRVALADVTGDGTADLVTAPGPGTTPTIHVFDGSTHQEIASFDAYESTFTGGVYVAAGDLTGDKKAEIVTGADQNGGPVVAVFDGATVGGTSAPTVLDDFLAIDDPNFRGGVRIALGDVNGDGTPDLIAGAGFDGGPRVAVYDGAALGKGQQVKLVNDFFAFEDTLRNGVFPGVGDLNGDGCGDLIFGAGPGGGPRVLALDGAAALAGSQVPLASFFAGSAGSRLGVQVGVMTNGSGNTSIVSTDLASGTTGVFDSAGAPEGALVGASGGPVCGAAGGESSGSGSTPTAIPVTQDTAAAVQGTYTGSQPGTLVTHSGTSADPTVTTADTTVTLAITGATLNLPPPSDGTTTTADSLTLTGTITVSVAGVEPVTGSFTGRFVLTADPANTGGVVQGELHVHAIHPGQDGPAPGVGFSLGGSLDGNSLTVDRFVLVDSANLPTATVFKSPGSTDADKLVLTRS
jgi:hypothetical protein